MASIHSKPWAGVYEKHYVDEAPSTSPGVAAPIGSLAIGVDSVVGQSWYKSGAGDQAWTRFDITALDDPGSAPINGIDLSTNPTDTDTITIGADTYEFVDLAVNNQVAADVNIAVVIGANAAATFAALLLAINGTQAAHNLVFQTDGVTPAEHIGTESVLGVDGTSQVLLVIPADAIGGTPVYGPAATAFSETLTAVVDWLSTNYNLLGGHAATTRRMITISDTITAAMITAGFLRLRLPFVPTATIVKAATAAGVEKALGTDSVAITGSDVLVTLNGGGGDLANTNVLTILAIE